MKKINNRETETEEPKTKPATKPRRETPKPEPRRENDPWTVPAPKVNPTPKAKDMDEDMKEEMKDVKVILKTKADFNLFRNTLGKKEFFDRFDVDMKLVSRMAAEDALKNAALEKNLN